MSLILKGIDLPQEEINLTITKDGRIYFNNKYHLIAEAIQIPKEHGRLIDVNKLYPSTLEKLEYGGSDGRMIYRKKFQAYTEKDIENAPTILGVEE